MSRKPCLLLLTIALFSICIPGKCFCDSLKESLLGRWLWKGKRKGVHFETTSIYKKGGEYSAIIRAKFLAIRSVVDCQGKWKLEGDDIVVTITQSSDEKELPKGTIFLMKDAKVSGDTLAYAFQGEFETEARLPAD